MSNSNKEEFPMEEVPQGAPEAEVAVSAVDFCTYFLQQLEGGEVIVPVSMKGDTAFTVFQFGKQRFKISVAALKRVRRLKESNGGGADRGNGGNGKDRTV